MNSDLGTELYEDGFSEEDKIDVSLLDKQTILDNDIFRNIFAINDQLVRTNKIVELEEHAKKLNVLRSFDKKLKAYQADYIQQFKQQGSNRIQFTNPPTKSTLKCGKWKCEDTGITKTILSANAIPITITACPHPIMPIERLINVDDNTEKIQLAFYKDNKWQTIVVDRNTIANKSSIIQLANRGIEVNSENAKDLVCYLADLINLNINTIKVSKSIDRAGWVENEFAPYIDGIKYDGDIAFKDLYESIKENGSYSEWKKHLIELRKYCKETHLLIAASFASPLIKLLGLNCFILHIWGTSGTGKTVALMAAMSVWGDPNQGKLVRTLNSTQTALNRCASFLNNLPFAGDELQVIKKQTDDFEKMIMTLTEGISRMTGTQYGNGINKVLTWNNIFMFTGEEPIIKSNFGEGTVNRVIEAKCGRMIENGNYTANFLRDNYGFAGKEFVYKLPEKDNLKQMFEEIKVKILNEYDTTNKQADNISVILLADKISTDLIFKDDNYLTIKDVKNYIVSKDQLDLSNRAYEEIIDWISANSNKFKEDSLTEIWGVFKDNKCYVNKKILTKMLNDIHIDFDSIKSKLFEKGYIEKNTKENEFTVAYRISGTITRCIAIKLPITNSDLNNKNDEELPF